MPPRNDVYERAGRNLNTRKGAIAFATCYGKQNGQDGKMETNDGNRSLWRFIDGSASITFSMLIAVAINNCAYCAGIWGIGFLKSLSDREDGVIILATLLLFPTTVALYGGLQMFFAAKEAVEKRAAERGRREGHRAGRREGRQEERERIAKALAEHGVALPPEVAEILDNTPDES